LIEEQKVVEIGKMAHQLKPSFTMVGLPEITQNLQVLEKKAKNNEDFNEIKQVFDEIENIFNRKIGLVQKEFDSLQ
jgi:HPt (histidine-containing phosphotransfer) domain-containing protein